MNKEHILLLLGDFSKRYNIPKTEIIVMFGAALVFQGIREEAEDIDLFLKDKYCKKLIESGHFRQMTVPDSPTTTWLMQGVYDVRNTGAPSVKCREGYFIQTADSILEAKKKLGREKDLKDIAALSKVLGRKL